MEILFLKESFSFDYEDFLSLDQAKINRENLKNGYKKNTKKLSFYALFVYIVTAKGLKNQSENRMISDSPVIIKSLKVS